MILVDRRPLLDGFRRGDRSALPAVYTHYVKDVSRFLTRGFTFNSAGKLCSFRGFRGGYEIEAALQEIFRRAFEERARLAYNGIDPYRPYLLRIARNTVINDLKSKQPILFRFRSGRPVIIESADADDGIGDHLPEPTPSAEAQLEAREVAKLVAAFKDRLGEREQAVFRLRFEEGLSAEVAGSQAGLTRSQIRTTETKLRKRMLEHLHRAGYLTNYKPHETAAAISGAVLVMILLQGAP